MNLPRTLLGGRVRTSTLGLLLSFAMVMTVWILVRPEPVEVTEEVVTVRTTKTVPGREEATPTPVATPRPTETPKPTPAPATPKPTKGPAAPTATPTPEGGAGGLLSPPPTPSGTPDGLF